MEYVKLSSILKQFQRILSQLSWTLNYNNDCFRLNIIFEFVEFNSFFLSPFYFKIIFPTQFFSSLPILFQTTYLFNEL